MWTFGPRQNTDAALLPTISYPAFAVDDDALYSQTLDKIVRKLRGKYGFKRFLRDGYRTANEDKDRRYYKPAEMKVSAVKIKGIHSFWSINSFLFLKRPVLNVRNISSLKENPKKTVKNHIMEMKTE